jgi:hypothetical protein
MRNKRLLKLSLLLALLGAAPLRAAPPADETEVAPPRSSADRPEYLPEPISDDDFKPSKEISDDYPIDLPVDI